MVVVTRTLLLASRISTSTFGSAVPIKRGRVLAVIPSPWTPVSSRGLRPRVGTVVGPWVLMVKENCRALGRAVGVGGLDQVGVRTVGPGDRPKC